MKYIFFGVSCFVLTSCVAQKPITLVWDRITEIDILVRPIDNVDKKIHEIDISKRAIDSKEIYELSADELRVRDTLLKERELALRARDALLKAMPNASGEIREREALFFLLTEFEKNFLEISEADMFRLLSNLRTKQAHACLDRWLAEKADTQRKIDEEIRPRAEWHPSAEIRRVSEGFLKEFNEQLAFVDQHILDLLKKFIVDSKKMRKLVCHQRSARWPV